ncbi:NAD(P)H-hydrate dehydratase [Rhodocyclus gracilis]|nr:NAD(P)H-hydrate dehydratase [Rhodocyclus gracilis]
MHADATELILTVRAIRALERDSAHSGLMERAGHAAADLAESLAGTGGHILIVAGPGANGGDAFVTARLLRERFFAVSLVALTTSAATATQGADPDDTAAARVAFVAEGGELLESIPDDTPWALIIDGLFGIGLSRPPRERAAELISAMNALARRHACPVLALDCPSGLNADTGHAQPTTVRASHTLSFIAAKPGLLTGDGPDYCGQLRVDSLGLTSGAANPGTTAAATDSVPPREKPPSAPSAPLISLNTAEPPPEPAAQGHIIQRRSFARHLRARASNSHKGSFGSAVIIGGAPGMAGAALLAGRAALKLGAGRVYLGLLDERFGSVDPVTPELMLRPASSLAAQTADALLLGPGLGSGETAQRLMEQLCGGPVPLVLDADALNLLSTHPALAARVHSRQAATVLTPHPGEAARLLASSINAVQSDRIAAASALARRFNAHVVLKGSGSIVALADGRWFINTTGNPGMASGGMGDVLGGILVALLSQGWPADEAALAAVHLHGAAADRLAEAGIGPIGLTASETIDAARHLFNRWCAGAE